MSRSCDLTAAEPSPVPIIRLDGDGWGLAHPVVLEGHHATLSAWEPVEVAGVIAEAEEASGQGYHVAGFISYEAAQALNPILPSNPPLPFLPLAWFALYRDALPTEPLPAASGNLPLQPALEPGRYRTAVERVLDYIAAGDCYQVNLTFPLTGQSIGKALLPHYLRMLRSQRSRYSAFIDAGPFSLLSLSPELFFRRDDASIRMRPMKGTTVRGRFPAEDRLLAERLRLSPKEQAENVMIVDMLRNDLGKVAEIGTVQVPELFALESYPTVHQMTSTVAARLRPGLSLAELLAALFPCGSVTGAPKRRSMEIIAELEGHPRGVYCGAIGYLPPGSGTAVFSVAIRTLLADHARRQLSLGVGSGVTADSSPDAEYRECLAKGAFMTNPPPNVGLIESLRLEQGAYPLLERHMNRLAWSAGRLGIPCDLTEARRLLERASAPSGTHKVRLHLDHSGGLTVTSEPLESEPSPLSLAVDADHPVDPRDLLLYLKTDRRERYFKARARHSHYDEVLLVNSRGELTEGSYNSLVVEIAGEKFTPPLASGLLPGIFRESLLENGEVAERVLYPADLKAADEIWLVNAVRGWRRGTLSGCRSG